MAKVISKFFMFMFVSICFIVEFILVVKHRHNVKDWFYGFKNSFKEMHNG